MIRVVSIDPGGIHCGVAMWVGADTGKWSCEWAREFSVEGCIDFVFDCDPDEIDRVIVEGFWLKPGFDALRQAGSEMETVEVIGAIRHICRRVGMPFQKVANGQDSIRKKLNSRGYPWTAYGYGTHAHDAEAVGYRGLDLRVGQLEALHGDRT